MSRLGGVGIQSAMAGLSNRNAMIARAIEGFQANQRNQIAINERRREIERARREQEKAEKKAKSEQKKKMATGIGVGVAAGALTGGLLAAPAIGGAAAGGAAAGSVAAGAGTGFGAGGAIGSASTIGIGSGLLGAAGGAGAGAATGIGTGIAAGALGGAAIGGLSQLPGGQVPAQLLAQNSPMFNPQLGLQQQRLGLQQQGFDLANRRFDATQQFRQDRLSQLDRGQDITVRGQDLANQRFRDRAGGSIGTFPTFVNEQVKQGLFDPERGNELLSAYADKVAELGGDEATSDAILFKMIDPFSGIQNPPGFEEKVLGRFRRNAPFNQQQQGPAGQGRAVVPTQQAAPGGFTVSPGGQQSRQLSTEALSQDISNVYEGMLNRPGGSKEAALQAARSRVQRLRGAQKITDEQLNRILEALGG